MQLLLSHVASYGRKMVRSSASFGGSDRVGGSVSGGTILVASSSPVPQPPPPPPPSINTHRAIESPPHATARSHSLEHSAVNSPSSSSSSNSHVGADRMCLRQSAQPKFPIMGDLNPAQIQIVKRTWKQLMKSVDDDETEIATRLLLRVFALEPRNVALFDLPPELSFGELRHQPAFVRHVKAFEPTLIHVMTHPNNPTSLSRYLQQLGGRHVQNTGVTYKSSYWKTFVQALIDVVADKTSADSYEAFTILAAFCVEQMRIGYKIEYKLQREAERIARVQLHNHKRGSVHQSKRMS